MSFFMENLKPISETHNMNLWKIDRKDKAASRERETWRIAGAQDPIFFQFLEKWIPKHHN